MSTGERKVSIIGVDVRHRSADLRVLLSDGSVLRGLSSCLVHEVKPEGIGQVTLTAIIMRPEDG